MYPGSGRMAAAEWNTDHTGVEFRRAFPGFRIPNSQSICLDNKIIRRKDMSFTAKDVMTLRQRTGAGMMDCGNGTGSSGVDAMAGICSQGVVDSADPHHRQTSSTGHVVHDLGRISVHPQFQKVPAAFISICIYFAFCL